MTNLIAFLHTTAAYQAAVLQLMVGEANFASEQLNLPERLPSATNLLAVADVWPAPMGVGGGVGSSNYVFQFEKGRLIKVLKTDWMQKLDPSATNLFELSKRPSLIDTDAAFQLATQWLSRLWVDLPAVEAKYPHHVTQMTTRIPGDRSSVIPRNRRGIDTASPAIQKVMTPLFTISWGDHAPPMDLSNPVRVKILGSTKELIELDIKERSVSLRPRLVLTNKAELLGPLPLPRYFVEQLLGSRIAYDTVASPARAEAFLLRESNAPGKTISKGNARALANILLDFDSYYWMAQKLCAPEYGLKIRFIRDASIVDVSFCFDCDILAVTSNGATPYENFDFRHNDLVRIARKLFPRAPSIQKLEIEPDQRPKMLEMIESYRDTE
jgi:hypothetical protein